jgi:hypothetical protein
MSVSTFLANARDLRLARSYAGAERLLTFELLLDELEDAQTTNETVDQAPGPGAIAQPRLTRLDDRLRTSASPAPVMAEAVDLSDVCFFIPPIGADNSEYRKHPIWCSDLLSNQHWKVLDCDSCVPTRSANQA